MQVILQKNHISFDFETIFAFNYCVFEKNYYFCSVF